MFKNEMDHEFKSECAKEAATILSKENPISILEASRLGEKVATQMEKDKLGNILISASSKERTTLIELYAHGESLKIQERMARMQQLDDATGKLKRVFSGIGDGFDALTYSFKEIFSQKEKQKPDNVVNFLEKKKSDDLKKSKDNNRKAGKRNEKRFY